MAEPTPKDHAGCADWLRSHFINDGIDVVISTEPFLVVGPYTLVDGEPCSMTCPHGTTFYWEPTGDQVAEWVREGVR